MKKVVSLSLLASALLAAPAFASQDLAKAKNCLACHGVDNKVVGPAYKDVAKKYAKQKDAEAYLVKKIREGSTGVWGQVPMPANANVNPQEAQTLAKWILGLK
jgi:cytochrome c